MTESILVERDGAGGLWLNIERTEDDPGTKPILWEGTEDQLHTELVRDGYLRVGPARGDQIAGLYVRKVAA